MFHKEGAKIILVATTLTVLFIFLADKFVTIFWLQKVLQFADQGRFETLLMRRGLVGQVEEFEQQYNDGLITQGEKYNKVVDASG